MGMVSEFKEFAVKGNVIDLAVGVIIGGAFGKIVDSVVTDLIMPVVSMVFGRLDFSNWYLPLAKIPPGTTETLVELRRLIQANRLLRRFCRLHLTQRRTAQRRTRRHRAHRRRQKMQPPQHRQAQNPPARQRRKRLLPNRMPRAQNQVQKRQETRRIKRSNPAQKRTRRKMPHRMHRLVQKSPQRQQQNLPKRQPPVR